MVLALGVATGCGRIGFESLDPDARGPGVAIAVSPLGAGGSDPSLVWTGEDFAISWHQDDGNGEAIYVRLLDRDAQPVGEQRLLSGELPSSNSSLVFGGDRFGLCWQQAREGGGSDIYFIALDRAGVPLGPASRVSQADSLAQDPRITWLGDRFAVAWWDASGGGPEHIDAAYLSPTGAIEQALQVSPAETGADDVDVAAFDGKLALVWEDDREAVTRIRFARLDAAGSVIDDLPVTDGNTLANAPSLIPSGEGWLMAEGRGPSADREIGVTRLALDGSVIDAGAPLFAGHAPTLAASSTQIALGWQDRFASDGLSWVVVLDDSALPSGDPVQIGSDVGTGDVDLVWSGDLVAAAWEDERHGDDTIYVQLLDLR